MKQLAANMPLDTVETVAKVVKGPTEVKVIVTAEFGCITPAHERHIVKQGSGSNLDRAVRDAIHIIFTDKKLRGKKAERILQSCRMTVQFISSGEKENES